MRARVRPRRGVAWAIACAIGLAIGGPLVSSTARAGQGEHRLEDASGQTVATFVLRPGTPSSVGVPAGSYVHVAPDGTRTQVRVAPGERFVAGASTPAPRPASPTPVAARPEPLRRDAPVERGRVRRPWLAPLAATLLPGSGYAVARLPGAAFGTFAAAAGLSFGSIALGLAGSDAEGATLGEAGRSATREALRHGAFVAVTDALALLWIGQAADAWVRAKGKTVRPRTGHVIGLSLHRASTVGVRPGEPAMARYEDLSLAILGQVRDRLSIGIADLGVHARSGGRVTLQAGVRAAGRVVQRGRVWLVVAGGLIFQGTSGRSTRRSADPDADAATQRGRFGVTVYGQLETRVFVLDRLSLDVGPRLSVPLATRYYGGGKALPRWAPTLELVAGPQVYF